MVVYLNERKRKAIDYFSVEIMLSLIWLVKGKNIKIESKNARRGFLLAFTSWHVSDFLRVLLVSRGFHITNEQT